MWDKLYQFLLLQTVSRSKVSSKMNPDIQEERSKIQFNIEEFTNWYHGGKTNVEEKRFIGKDCFFKIILMLILIIFPENFFLNDPEMQSNFPTCYMSHKELYEDALRRTAITLRKLQELQAQGRFTVDLNR